MTDLKSPGWISICAASLFAIALLFALLIPLTRSHLLRRWQPLIVLWPWIIALGTMFLWRSHSLWWTQATRTQPLVLIGVAAFILNLPAILYYCGRAAEAVPQPLREMALLDGASASQRFWTVFLPLGGMTLLTSLLVAVTQTGAALLLLTNAAFAGQESSFSLSTSLEIVAALSLSSLLAILTSRAAIKGSGDHDSR